MKYHKTEDRLLDLYGISKAEARFHWNAKIYNEVLKSKIKMAQKLQSKLLDYPLKSKDSARIKRIGDAVVFNQELLKEVE